MSTSLKRKRLLIFLANLLLMLFCGLLYAWTIFVTPLESEFGWSRAQTSLTFTLSLSCSTLAAGFASKIAEKLGRRRLTLLAGLVVGAGMAGVSFVNSLWQLYVLYGLVCAVAIGVVYNLTLGTIVRWYPDKSNLVTGGLLMGFGLGGMALGSVAAFLIHLFEWRIAFQVLGASGFVIFILCAFSVELPTPELSEALAPFRKSPESVKSRDYTPSTMIRTRAFWNYVLWYVPISAIGLTVSGHSSPIAQSIGLDVNTAAFYAGCVSALNGFGRVMFGRVLDTKGRKPAVLIVNSFVTVGILLLIASLFLGAKPLLLAAFVLTGLGYGGGPVMSTNVVKSFFGEANYGSNIGFGNYTIIAGAVIGPYFGGLLYQSQGYLAVSVALLVLAACSILFCRKIFVPSEEELRVRGGSMKEMPKVS